MGKDADLFTEGSIYYYENRSNTKSDYLDNSVNHDFLVSRPVLVLKQRPAPLDDYTVNVVTITSSNNRVGIPININGLKNGKIMPNKIYSLHKEYLTQYMGKVSDEIIKEVNESVKYFFGFSDKKPQYLIDYENELIRREKTINELTLKERSVYEFIKNKCVFKDIYYTNSSELFYTYRKGSYSDSYTKHGNFSNSLNKILTLFPNITCTMENGIKVIHGFSINGNTHKIGLLPQESTKHKRETMITLNKNIVEDTNLENMRRDELIMALTDKSRKIYEQLDIIQKIQNYVIKDPYYMQIDNVIKDDLPIIKQLIEKDVGKRKMNMLRLLDRGLSPMELNTTEQYVFYICDDNEIMRHISSKYLKKGGLPLIRRNIKNNIKHLFVKL